MYAKLKQNKTLFDLKIKAIWNSLGSPWSPISQTIKVTIQFFLRKLLMGCKCYCGFKKILSCPNITNYQFKIYLLSTVCTEMNMR